MRPWFAAVAALAVAALAAPSPAQSLAEVAARTKKKEEKTAKPAKVYTESDLRTGGGSGGAMSQMEGPVAVAASPAPGGAAAAPAAGEKPKTPDEERAEKQAAWRERQQAAQAEVTRLTDDVNRLQIALNDLTGPLYGGNRAGLQTRLEDSKRQLGVAQQTVLDLQEEGRRARY